MHKHIRFNHHEFTLALGLAMALALSACSTGSRLSAKEEALAAENSELKSLLAQMSSRIESIDTRINSMNEKMDSTRTSVDNILGAKKANTIAVAPSLQEHRGATIEAHKANSDPDAAFKTDAAIKTYRQASVLFLAQKYPESVLAFSSFLERYADHALAGSAQFYIAESYFKQKEYQLALQEYQRVLTSYDRCPCVPEALSQMITIEESLKRNEDAQKHRQLLLSLFPQSPAAEIKTINEKVQTKEEPKVHHDSVNKTQADEIPPTAPVSEPEPVKKDHST